jgi:hypothetical protein
MQDGGDAGWVQDGGEGVKVEFKANSRFTMDCLLLGGFGVRLSCADRSAVEGGGTGARLGMSEGSVAWVREGALGAHLEFPHTVLGDCVGFWDSGVCLRFHNHLKTDMGT